MKTLFALLLILPSLALSYPAGPANSVVRVPPAGGPVTTGPVDLTKSAAVTGLSANAIPFWNGVGAVGLGNSNCTWNNGTLTLTCGNTVVFSGSSVSLTGLVGPGMLAINSAELIQVMDNWVSRATIAFCGSSPCTITRQFPASPNNGVSSVTRTSLGVYVVNFVAGYWTATPSCTASTSTATRGDYTCKETTTISTTSFNMTCYDRVNVADAGFNVTCVGDRN